MRPSSAKERERFTVPAVASRFGRIKEKSLNANCVQTQSGGCWQGYTSGMTISGNVTFTAQFEAKAVESYPRHLISRVGD